MCFKSVISGGQDSRHTQVYVPEVHSLFVGDKNHKQRYNDFEDTSKYQSTAFQS